MLPSVALFLDTSRMAQDEIKRASDKVSVDDKKGETS